MTTDLSPAEQRARTLLAIEAGMKLACDGGIKAPKLGDAIWELFIEASDTLRRLPDRERGWLKVRSGMPEPLREGMDYADPDEETRLGPPRKEAIDRMEEVLSWYQFFSRYARKAEVHKWRRDLQVVFSLASGLPNHAIAGRARVKVGMLPKIRDKQIKAVAFELNRRLAG